MDIGEDSPLKVAKIQRLFDVYDADQNGVLEKADFQSVVDNFARARQLPPESSQYQRLQSTYMNIWAGLQREADEDGDGQVTLEEMRYYHDLVIYDPSLFQKHVVGLTELLFELLDSNSDGTISESEYLEFARCLRFEADSGLFQHLTESRGFSKELLRQRISEFYYSELPDAPGNWLFGRLDQ